MTIINLIVAFILQLSPFDLEQNNLNQLLYTSSFPNRLKY